jgi:hypothetical protein
MRWSLAARLVCLLGLALPVAPARAMQFEQVQISSTEVILGGRGPIVKGDAPRLEQALAALPQSKRLLALALDSPGGLVTEGEQLAALIRTRKLPVVIPSNSQCVSACFLLLAASPHRMAASDALVGVHSANENQKETDISLAVTTLMARDAAKDGIPAAIIGKMVETTPGRVEWLTPADLTLMNVAVYDGDTPTATRQPVIASIRPAGPGPSPAPPSPAPLPQAPLPQAPLPQASVSPAPPPQASVRPASPPQASAGPGFTAGRDDGRAWDTWLAGLRGPYRDGAVFAQAQSGLPRPGSCYGPNGANRGDFTLGCEVARQRLAPVATRLAVNAAYAAGWNSASQPIQTGTSTEAEYQGAYFCGRQMAHLTLKILPPAGKILPPAGQVAPQPGEARRRATFSFGPEPTSPDVPRGAFIVEGSIDLQGGALTLAPVAWISQPQGYNWLGLSGRSDDGGRTFSGHVTDSSTCTIFTLKRVGAATTTR